jgi:hypothetical protein
MGLNAMTFCNARERPNTEDFSSMSRAMMIASVLVRRARGVKTQTRCDEIPDSSERLACAKAQPSIHAD